MVNRIIHVAAPDTAHPAASLSRRSVAAHATVYMRDGAHAPSDTPHSFTTPPNTAAAYAKVEAHFPTSAAPPGGWPLALISPGFLLNASLYRSYARSLASWGFVACLVDAASPTLLDDSQIVVSARARLRFES